MKITRAPRKNHEATQPSSASSASQPASQPANTCHVRSRRYSTSSRYLQNNTHPLLRCRTSSPFFTNQTPANGCVEFHDSNELVGWRAARVCGVLGPSDPTRRIQASNIRFHPCDHACERTCTSYARMPDTRQHLPTRVTHARFCEAGMSSIMSRFCYRDSQDRFSDGIKFEEHLTFGHHTTSIG